MELVAQEHTMGCGIACVASAAGVSYEEALSKTESALILKRGCYLRELKEALKKLGHNYNYKKYSEKDYDLLKNPGTIVFIRRSTNYPNGHYLLKTKKGWMDPWINCPEIAPAKAGYCKELPGEPQWILFLEE